MIATLGLDALASVRIFVDFNLPWFAGGLLYTGGSATRGRWIQQVNDIAKAKAILGE